MKFLMTRGVSWAVAVGMILSGCAPSPPIGSGIAIRPGLQTGPHDVVLNGVRHWYRVAGAAPADAPPVLFLHGGPGQGSLHFAELLGPKLEPSLRMIYFDQRGAGRSDRPADGEYSIPLMVEDIEQLRQSLRVPQIALIGQSFGGTLALEYAARYPEHVSRLVFVAGLWDTPLQCRLRLKTLAERRPDGYRRVRADTLRPDGTRISDCELEMRGAGGGLAWDEYSNEAMYPVSSVRTRIETVEAAHGYRNTGEVGGALFRSGLLDYRFTNPERLTMPVLIIAGGRDGAARPEGLRELADRLSHATVLEYERSGHFLYVDDPDRFAADVIDFLTPAGRHRRR